VGNFPAFKGYLWDISRSGEAGILSGVFIKSMQFSPECEKFSN
jgi:hypothetical protein